MAQNESSKVQCCCVYIYIYINKYFTTGTPCKIITSLLRTVQRVHTICSNKTWVLVPKKCSGTRTALLGFKDNITGYAGHEIVTAK